MSFKISFEGDVICIIGYSLSCIHYTLALAFLLLDFSWFSDSIHLVLFFSQSLKARLEQLNSEATLSFNNFLTHSIFFHANPFHEIFNHLIFTSLPPVIPCSSSLLHLSFSPLSPTAGCSFYLRWPFQRKTQRRTKKKLHRSTETSSAAIVPSRPLSLLLSILLVYVKSHHRSQCKCVYLCNFHKLKVSLKWRPRGWWSVALPSSLCCQPPGDHTSTHVHRDNFTHMPACSHSHTQTQKDACTFPLLGSSVPEARLCLSRPLHKLDFSF